MQLVAINNRDLQLFQTNYLDEIFLWVDPQNDYDKLFQVLNKIMNNPKVEDKMINNLISAIEQNQIQSLSELRDYITHKIQLHSFANRDVTGTEFQSSFFTERFLHEVQEEKIKNSLDGFLLNYNEHKYPFVKEFVEKCKQARLSDV